MATEREPVGILKTPPAYISIVAAATPVTLWQVSANRTAKLVRLMVANRNGASGYLQIGRLLAGLFVQLLPDIYLAANLTFSLGEEDLPAYLWGYLNAIPPDNITAQASIGAAPPNDVRILPTVEEIGP